MKKITPLSTRQNTNKAKFTKLQSHQITSSNIYDQKNSTISLMTSPSNSKKSFKNERLFSPSEQTKDKIISKKQKLKNIQIFSPNNKNKVKLDLEIKKSLFDKNPESFRHNKKLKYPKDIDDEHCLTSYNEREKSPFKKEDLNKKIMISESKRKGQYDDNDLYDYSDKFNELGDTLNTYKNNQKDEILNQDIYLDEKIKRNEEDSFYDNNIDENNMEPLQKQLKLIKNLLRSKNYQNFVKKILNSENILINDNGKLLKFNIFKEDLYNYEFLDVYYKHHIPFIIMRPRFNITSQKSKKTQKRTRRRKF